MKKNRIWLYATVLVLFSSCYMLKESDQFYNIGTSNLSTVYLIDVSGSMEGKQEANLTDKAIQAGVNKGSSVLGKAVGGKLGRILSKRVNKEATKLGAVKRKLIPAIKGLPDGKQFLIYTFSDDVKSYPRNFMTAKSSTRTLSIGYIDRIKSGGGTRTLKALKRVLSVRGVQEIVLMTDGQPTDASAKQILTKIQQLNKNNKVVINAIAFGDDADVDFLKSLARQNGGIFQHSAR